MSDTREAAVVGSGISRQFIFIVSHYILYSGSAGRSRHCRCCIIRMRDTCTAGGNDRFWRAGSQRIVATPKSLF